jgi:hypothetical protein
MIMRKLLRSFRGGNWNTGRILLLLGWLGLAPAPCLQADELDNWYVQSTPVTSELCGVFYGNGMFVAVGQKGMILTSTDGMNWTIQQSPTADDLEAVCFGNNIFVAVGATGTIITSSDGVNWFKRSSGTGETLWAVIWDATTPQQNTGTGEFVAVGNDGTVATSTGGASWTSVTRDLGSGYALWGVAAAPDSGGLAVVGGSDLIWEDGYQGWRSTNSGTRNYLYGVTEGLYQEYIRGSPLVSDDRYVAVGQAGTVLVADYNFEYIYSKWGGWTSEYVASENDLYGVRCLTYTTNYYSVGLPGESSYLVGNYVAVGDQGAIVTSADSGVTWIVRNSPTSAALIDVTYGNGIYVAVGAGGTIVATVPAPVPVFPNKGTYYGMFSVPGAVAVESSGCFTLTATSRGTYSGSAQLSSVKCPFTGYFDIYGATGGNIAGAKQTPVQLSLQVDPSDADHLIGTISSGSWTAQLMAERSVYDAKTNPAPQAGQYVMVIPGSSSSTNAPGGDGFGTARVTTAGKVTLQATLADGTVLPAQSGTLLKNGLWPLFVKVYGDAGLVTSWVTLTETPGSSVSGNLSWIKPALPAAKYYPGGFAVDTSLIGSRYAEPASGSNILALTNAVISFSGGGLTGAITNEIRIGRKNTVTNLSSNRLTLSFTTTDGVFQGTVVQPGAPKSKAISFSGVVLQDQDTGWGFFLNSGLSGQANLEPASPQ